jgi:hypothetical protein
MRLRDDGYSEQTCLDFDLAVNDFGDEYEEQLRATKQVPLTHRRRNPTVPAPLHDVVQLKRFLSIPDDLIGVRRDDDPELNRLAEDVLAGDAEWLLPSSWGDGEMAR